MRIAIDAMGGDKAPDAVISGALRRSNYSLRATKLILVGPKEVIEAKLPAQLIIPPSLPLFTHLI